MAKKQLIGKRQDAWLCALESGDYTQGGSYLRESKNKFCCLGVACEVQGVNRINGTKDRSYLYAGEDTFLPEETVKYFGFYGCGGDTKRHKFGRCLADLNDKGMTFAEIAAHVRKKPSRYFTEPK